MLEKILSVEDLFFISPLLVGRLYTAADRLVECHPPVEVLAASSDADDEQVSRPPYADEIPGLSREQRVAVQEIFDRHSSVRER